jgi:DNA-binding transcriptional LysR family regulator
LNALRNFEAVARHGSFAAASVELHVTHWAVGKQIRLLEDWLGVALFERRARGVTLTEEGAALLGDISSSFDRLTSAASRLRRNEPTLRIAGTVRVNVPPSFALYWLFPRMAQFHTLYPDVNVRISTTSRNVRYIGDAFDIGVRVGHEHGSGVVSRTLIADRRLPACSPSLLRERPIRDIADLRHHTWLHSATTRSSWSRWLQEAQCPGLVPLHQMEFEHAYLQIAAAVEGMGVALVSLPMIERDLAAGRLVCPFPNLSWHATDIALITQSERVVTDAILAFESWLQSTIEPARRA